MSLFCLNREDYIKTVSRIVREQIEAVGEDPDREGLRDTPERVAKLLRESLRGYCAEEEPKVTMFENRENYDEMIFDEGYFYSYCEHHMVPFFGKAFVAYIPDRKIIGISKLSRIVDHFAARLQIQERLTKQIAEFLQEKLEPKGVAVTLHARHLCREMRGVKKYNSKMTTTEVLSAFRTNPLTRQEFMNLVQNRLNGD
ncbi:MAG: GTP cyclohydrolase I FolE [Candidatus Aenigmarchaeota archaeon]|nr:GTP cyclohydrolase I FolE [Candidatus Aenigmarchaeota archaeon]